MPQKKHEKTILVTAGPTRAYLDDVRYISNVSTGETGFVICKFLKQKKLRVIAIVGPNDFAFESLQLFKLIRVQTREQMHQAVMDACRKKSVDAAIFAAAVLDFEPRKKRLGKVSSTRKNWNLELVPTPKIIDEVHKKFPAIIRIGFKLETTPKKSTQDYASKILAKKKLAALVFNYLDDVSKHHHHALGLSPGHTPHKLKTKLQIAKWILTIL